MEDAVAFTLASGPLAKAIEEGDADLKRAITEAVTGAYRGYLQDDGVVFPALARIVSARRPD